MKSIKNILGLYEIFENYEIFIIDQWGVMHDGQQGYLRAIDCVKKLFLDNKKLIIISNSSKRKAESLFRLPKLGFNSDNFIEVMTSGEMIWQSLNKRINDFTKNLGKNCFHIYDKENKNGRQYLDGLSFTSVSSIEDADFILGCTPFAKKKIIEYIPLLEIAKKNNLPFICANPDFDTIEKSSENLIFCMGTISELYKNMGGKTFILGKPNIDIYIESMKSIPNFDKSKILAIGDSIYHDIAGANNFGVDSLLITSGIHQNYFDKKYPIWVSEKNKLQIHGIQPTFLLSELKL